MERIAPKYNFNNLIATTYAAALAPDKWRALLIELCHILCVDDIALSFIDTKSISRSFTINAKSANPCHTTLPTGATKEFLQQLAPGQLGQLITSTQVSYPALGNNASDQWRASENWPYPESSQHIVPLLICEPAYVILFVQQAGEFSASNRALLAELTPHLMKCACVHNYTSELKFHNTALLGALEYSGTPLFILNADLTVIFTSREANALLKRHPALYLNERGQLSIHIPAEQNQLQKILGNFLSAEAINTIAENNAGIAIHHPDKQHPLRMRFVQLQQPDLHSPEIPFIAIFISDPEQPRQIDAAYLKQVFCLTPAEIHSAQLLLAGYSIAEIAYTRGTTLETARWQMKQLLQKTNTHSQAELMRLLVLLGNDVQPGQALLDIPPMTYFKDA